MMAFLSPTKPLLFAPVQAIGKTRLNHVFDRRSVNEAGWIDGGCFGVSLADLFQEQLKVVGADLRSRGPNLFNMEVVGGIQKLAVRDSRVAGKNLDCVLAVGPN